MERVIEVLRALLESVLLENGEASPALTGVAVRGVRGDSDARLTVQFADGCSVSQRVSRYDLSDFCATHGTWAWEEIRSALLDEALQIYEQMRDERGAAGPDCLGPQPWWACHDGLAYLTEVGTRAARERGMQLLIRNLTPMQRRQYNRFGHFDVIGGKTGRSYRIRHGRLMNIDQLDRKGRRVCGWCFYPRGRLVTGDVMLAQKLALELFEADALATANRW
jgi:hypothetical protein